MHKLFARKLNRTFLLLAIGALFVTAFVPGLSSAQTVHPDTEPVAVYVFERDDCTYCKAERSFLETFSETYFNYNFEIKYLDIVNDDEANTLYQTITTLKKVPRITPITIIGDTLIQGFDAPETTGQRIQNAIARAAQNDTRLTLDEFIADKTMIEGDSAVGCESGDVCVPTSDGQQFVFKLPFFGVVNLQTFSLTTLSVTLGVIDGFNPCAMWVLITFLLVLLQVGNRRKMWQIAGLFILAEAVMYWLILNVWYSTWDFVGLDQIVTPLVGFFAIGGGLYFLYKYYKSRKTLVCDITDLKTQGKIHSKIQHIAKGPLTIAAIGGIIAIAFSVNIIEFACSVGIPQAFTKILELNQLSFLQTQWFTFLYILFYMVDDLIVFGLALWGFKKIHSAEKYSRASMLIGGILMLILGGFLLFSPNLLTF